MNKIFKYDIRQMQELTPGIFTYELSNWAKLRKYLRQALVDKIGHCRFRVRYKQLISYSTVFLYGDVFEIVFFDEGDAALYKLTHM